MARVILLSFSILFLASNFNHVSAVEKGAIALPQTGQLTAYYQGDDGSLRTGVNWTQWDNQRFIDNGDGTITDVLTGLMWLKDANCMKTFYPSLDTDDILGDGAVKWQRALDFIEGINNGTYSSCSAGYSDWRLPNINELESLINAESDSVAWLGEKGFLNIGKQSYYRYWSSTTLSASTDRAWYLDIQKGIITHQYKTSFGFVWPVRGKSTPPALLWRTGQTVGYYTRDDGILKEGATWPTPRFVDNGDGTVRDMLTGLMWLKDANCIRTNYSSISPFGNVTWQTALDFVAGINSGLYIKCGGGYNDWRLPNRKELRSLIDYSQIRPPLSPGHPFINVVPDFSPYPPYWTSSTLPDGLGNAWTVSTYYYGETLYQTKTSKALVWPVRGGSYELYLAAKGLDNGIYYKKYANIGWGNWQKLPGGTSETPSISPSPWGHLYMLVRASSGYQIFGNYMYRYGHWTGWKQMPGQTDKSATLINFNEKLYMFVKGLSGGIYYSSVDTINGWSGWKPIPVSGSTTHSPVATVFDNKLWVFVKGGDSGIYYTSMDILETWSQWKRVNGSTDTNPAVATYGGRVFLVVKGNNSSNIYLTTTSDGISWNPWILVNGATPSAPSLTVHDAFLYVFVRGLNNSIYWRTWGPNGWRTSWSPVDGGSTDKPVGVSEY